jgi:hypothetical protein
MERLLFISDCFQGVCVRVCVCAYALARACVPVFARTLVCDIVFSVQDKKVRKVFG